MDKVLTSNAIDNAFYTHVAKRFEALCASGEGSHYEKARVAFEADLRFAQRAHDDIMAQLAAHEAEEARAAQDAQTGLVAGPQGLTRAEAFNLLRDNQGLMLI